MSQEIQAFEDHSGDIKVYRDPERVLEEARLAAKALVSVLAQKPKKVMMNGEQYLEFEDWQTVGRFYGVTAKVVSTEFLDYGAVQGFLAKAVAIRPDGMEISAAEAMCLNDEDKWCARTKYEYHYVLKDGKGTQAEEPPRDQMEWIPNPNKPGGSMPKKVKVAAGEVKVPLFQLRSMAQTRACAKVLRNVLAWVVVLAGYKATPAEELEGMTTEVLQEQAPEGSDGDKPPIDPPRQKPAASKPAQNLPPLPAGPGTIQTVILGVESKSGEKNNKKYTLYNITDSDLRVYSTFDAGLADLANSAAATAQPVNLSYNVSGKYTNLVGLELIEREPGQEG